MVICRVRRLPGFRLTGEGMTHVQTHSYQPFCSNSWFWLSRSLSVVAQTGRQSPAEQERPRLESRGKKGDDNQQRPPGEAQPQSQTDESGTIKIDTTLVTIPVSVLDRDGKYVPNLTKRDFQVYEDGIEQEIADFTLGPGAFNVVLLLDTSRSTVFRLEDIQTALSPSSSS